MNCKIQLTTCTPTAIEFTFVLLYLPCSLFARLAEARTSGAMVVPAKFGDRYRYSVE
jgi:hypothetical protein